MKATLSSKGQIVLPRQVCTRLQLRPGARFVCKVEGDSIILTLEPHSRKRPRLILDRAMGLRITKSPPNVKVSNEDVRAVLTDFHERPGNHRRIFSSSLEKLDAIATLPNPPTLLNDWMFSERMMGYFINEF